MIIERFRATIKRGHREEAVAMIKHVGGKRIGLVFAGDNDILTFDEEHEDLAAYAAAIEERAKPETQSGFKEMGWWEISTAMVTELIMIME